MKSASLFVLLLLPIIGYSVDQSPEQTSRRLSIRAFSKTKKTLSYFYREKILFLPKSVWFKKGATPKNLKIQRTTPEKIRIESLTGKGAVTNWLFGKGFRVFALTSAAYKKKPIKKEPVLPKEDKKTLSETNGNLNFGMGWSLLKEQSFSFDFNTSLNFLFHIENQVFYSRFFKPGAEEVGNFLFDGVSLGIVCTF